MVLKYKKIIKQNYQLQKNTLQTNKKSQLVTNFGATILALNGNALLIFAKFLLF